MTWKSIKISTMEKETGLDPATFGAGAALALYGLGINSLIPRDPNRAEEKARYKASLGYLKEREKHFTNFMVDRIQSGKLDPSQDVAQMKRKSLYRENQEFESAIQDSSHPFYEQHRAMDDVRQLSQAVGGGERRVPFSVSVSRPDSLRHQDILNSANKAGIDLTGRSAYQRAVKIVKNNALPINGATQ